MLLRFTVENFMSFKNREELSLVPSKVRRHKDHVISSGKRNEIKALKAAVIYGANASGKSNLIKAIHSAKLLITSGVRPGKDLPYIPFMLNSESITKPSRFEFEIKCGEKNYAYGFINDRHFIIEEWLYEITKSSEKRIFVRTLANRENSTYTFEHDIDFKSEEDEQFFKFTATGTPNNRLFLNECAERNISKQISYLANIESVRSWFSDDLKIIFPNTKYSGLERDIEDDTDFSTLFSKILKSFDTGINNLVMAEVNIDSINELPSELKEQLLSRLDDNSEIIIAGPSNVRFKICKNDKGIIHTHKLMTCHLDEQNSEVRFELNQESDGTLRLLDLTPSLIDVYKSEVTYIIDELDRSLHPDITTSIIHSFLKNTVGIKSQLIVTTHETTLLNQDFLRKDEVWFSQKNKDGSSSLYSLEEYQPRFDKDIRRSYLAGRFGGVPHIPQSQNLSWMINNA